MNRSLITLFIAPVMLASLHGCAENRQVPEPSYSTVAADPRRNTDAARTHNTRAAELITAGKLAEAETACKAALKADLFFGPAHNNLGTVYYRQKLYYKAAWEFQYAAKLMATQAAPRNNLGLVCEAVGKLPDAVAAYTEALTLEPDAVEITANLARARVRSNLLDDETRSLLQDIVLKDTRPTWITWAQERLAMMGLPKDPTKHLPPTP